MELDSNECVSYTDGMEDDDDPAAPAQLPRPFLKSAATVSAVAAAADRGGGAGAGPLVPPATGVHELLECPVCTNSMYPPIHQVRFVSCFPFRGISGSPCRQYGFLVARAWRGFLVPRMAWPAISSCPTFMSNTKHGVVIRTLELKTNFLLLQIVLLTPGLAA
jgi:hypothetical protein